MKTQHKISFCGVPDPNEWKEGVQHQKDEQEKARRERDKESVPDKKVLEPEEA